MESTKFKAGQKIMFKTKDIEKRGTVTEIVPAEETLYGVIVQFDGESTREGFKYDGGGYDSTIELFPL